MVRGEAQLSRSHFSPQSMCGRTFRRSAQDSSIEGEEQGDALLFSVGQQGALSVGVCMLRCKMLEEACWHPDPL